MPSKSTEQQRLFGIAYSIKKGDAQLSDLDKSLQKKIKPMIDSMSKNKLKEYASTKHDSIDEDSATTANTPGMGNTSLPSSDNVGSGDVPGSYGNISKHKKPTNILSFDEFIEMCSK